MSARRKLLLIYATRETGSQSLAEHNEQLVKALRARGAEVEELSLATDPNILLDLLEAGAMPVVIKKGR